MSDQGHTSSHHIVPIPVYLAIFGALLILTGVTVWVAFQDMHGADWMHTPLALGIATAKAILVVLWFMHVKYSVRLVWVFIVSGLLWLAILLAVTGGDYVGRRWEQPGTPWQAAAPAAVPEVGRA